MEEYILKTANVIDWQKWLNQWRHTYELEIISMQESLRYDNHVTILLKRTPK